MLAVQADLSLDSQDPHNKLDVAAYACNTKAGVEGPGSAVVSQCGQNSELRLQRCPCLRTVRWQVTGEDIWSHPLSSTHTRMAKYTNIHAQTCSYHTYKVILKIHNLRVCTHTHMKACIHYANTHTHTPITVVKCGLLYVIHELEKWRQGAGEMAGISEHWRSSEDPSSLLSTHTAVHIPLQLQFWSIWCPGGSAYTWCTDIHADKRIT